MIKSIRQYISIYLSLSISILSIFLISISNFYFDKKDIQRHLDSIMAISALTVNTTIENLDNEELKDIQKKFNKIYQFYSSHFEHIQLPHFSTKKYARNFNIQILDNSGKRIDFNPQYATLPPSIVQHLGFHDLKIHHQQWRFFVSKHPKLDIFVVFGERIKYRNALIHKITRDDLLISLLIFPISILIIFFVVTKSLSPLKQITKEIKTRNPYHLTPVDIETIPDEIKPLITEINQLLFRLKDALTREQAFAADAAHELRTPLATIKTLSQIALEYHPQEEVNLQLQKIIQNVDRGSHVIQQLMNMSKTMPEALLLSSFESIKLGPLAQETLSQITPYALERRMEVELDVAPKLPKIKGNKVALQILVRNLVDNAIRYSFPNTTIFVNLYSTDKTVVLEVRDQGPGIPKLKQNKVFDRFYRAHEPKYQGSGLGLAIVKQIANLHHAQITLESPYHDKGTIIRIFFPVNT